MRRRSDRRARSPECAFSSPRRRSDEQLAAVEGLGEGLQAYTQSLDLKHLGPDVYTALVEVWFDGGRKQKWERFGVIR